MSDGIKKGGDRDELTRRFFRVLNKEAPGLIVVFDENGMMDFGHDVSLQQVRNAAIEYACDLAKYPGD